MGYESVANVFLAFFIFTDTFAKNFSVQDRPVIFPPNESQALATEISSVLIDKNGIEQKIEDAIRSKILGDRLSVTSTADALSYYLRSKDITSSEVAATVGRLLLPYLLEDGHCTGRITSLDGLQCSYALPILENVNKTNFSGEIKTESTVLEIKQPSPESSLNKIFALSILKSNKQAAVSYNPKVRKDYIGQTIVFRFQFNQLLALAVDISTLNITNILLDVASLELEIYGEFYALLHVEEGVETGLAPRVVTRTVDSAFAVIPFGATCKAQTGTCAVLAACIASAGSEQEYLGCASYFQKEFVSLRPTNSFAEHRIKTSCGTKTDNKMQTPTHLQ